MDGGTANERLRICEAGFSRRDSSGFSRGGSGVADPPRHAQRGLARVRGYGGGSRRTLPARLRGGVAHAPGSPRGSVMAWPSPEAVEATLTLLSSALRAGGSRWGCGSDLAQPTGAALPAHRRPRVGVSPFLMRKLCL